jgi:AraC-like DNA-binding protein
VNTTTHIGILSVFIFLGGFLGFILSFFFIFKQSSNNAANRYQGLLLLSLSLCVLEQVISLTGYIASVLPLTFVSASVNFLIGPLLYLFVKRSIDQSGSKSEWIHFVIPGLYLIYLTFDFIQPNEFKYNIYIRNYHPDWQQVSVPSTISNDPLGINNYLTIAQAVQIILYICFSFRKLVKKAGEAGTTIFRTADPIIKSLRYVIIHGTMIILVLIAVKTIFENNAGDYFIGIYIGIFTLLTTIRVMNHSTYFDYAPAFLDLSLSKYQKSSLTDSWKKKILESILYEFQTKEYFSDNLASLSDIAKRIGESPHHVSQVINEKLNKSFFELLASYRIEKAKAILSEEKNSRLTIEEISEMVGYNSKTAFNNSFKRLTDKTPSDFRKQMIQIK